jgi:hypothetical protein
VSSKEKRGPKRSLTPREVAVIRKIDAEIARVLADPEGPPNDQNTPQQNEQPPVVTETEHPLGNDGTSTDRNEP